MNHHVTRATLTGLLALFVLGSAATPAAAQQPMDLQGVWNHNGLMVEDRAIIMNATGGGARIGDYTGFPLNDAGRQQTDSWMASRMELPEHQCHPHPAQYTLWGPGNFRFTNILDPLSNGMIWTFAVGGKIFVYQSTTLIVGYSYGFFDSWDCFRIGLSLTVVESLILLFLVPLFWPLIGLG